MEKWTYLKPDRELFARELDSFMPERFFDAHAHLYAFNHFNGDPPIACQMGPATAGWSAFRKYNNQITPGREVSGLFFPFPAMNVNFEKTNKFTARETGRDAKSRAQMLIKPGMDPEYIRETVRREGFVGLKPYHLFSTEKPTPLSQIPDYLPEEHVRIAHEEGLTITLHMVRPRAMADPGNQEILRTWGKKYKNARFILAHAARGFNPNHTVEGIGALKGLRNMWCDTSAVTDSGAFEAIIQALGVDRLLYGSDFPVTHIRGRCVALGDSFFWMYASNTDFNQVIGDSPPTLVGLESLRTLKHACTALKLSDSKIQAIFHDNAAKLFGLK